LKTIILFGALVCAWGQTAPAMASDKKGETKAAGELDPQLRARLAMAQRDYQTVKAQLDAMLLQQPAAHELSEATKAVDEACRALGKVANYDAVRCDEPPKKAEDPKAAEDADKKKKK